MLPAVHQREAMELWATEVKLVRESDGSVRLYTGGALRFTTANRQTAPVRLPGHSSEQSSPKKPAPAVQ